MTSWFGTLVLGSNRVRAGLTVFMLGLTVFSVYTSMAFRMDGKEEPVVNNLPEKNDEAFVKPRLECEKVAIVIIPLENDGEYFMTDLTNEAILHLEELNYTIVRIEARADLPTIQASQVVLLYIGHGTNECPNTVYTVSRDQICLSEILESITTERLIMLTNACGGGSWLKLQAENRLIISSVNDTLSYIVGSDCAENGPNFKVTIVDLIEMGNYQPLEQAYEQLWAPWVMRFYETEGYPGVHPVIYDGIAGEVWL